MGITLGWAIATYQRVFPMQISRFRPMVAACTLSLAALPGHAQQSSRPGWGDVFTFEVFATSIMHSMLSAARVLADIRYDRKRHRVALCGEA